MVNKESSQRVRKERLICESRSWSA